MKVQLTIGEFSKLKNISAETLRHYDRVDLLKPVKIDPKSGYRYYSILQYEKLSTILELRALGMSIEDIKHFFDQRNVSKSLELLKEQHELIEKKIFEMQGLADSIKSKVKHLEFVSNVEDYKTIHFKTFGERYILTNETPINHEVMVGYDCMAFENEIDEVAPIVGSNKYGVRVVDHTPTLFLFVSPEDEGSMQQCKIIPKGTYACLYFKGAVDNIMFQFEGIERRLKAMGCNPLGEILGVIQIDISVTDQIEEIIYELQVLVKTDSK